MADSPAAPSPRRAEVPGTVTERFDAFFTRAAVLSLLMTVGAVIVSVMFLSGAAEAIVLSAFGAGGIWLAAMCLLVRNRVRTGPRREPRPWAASLVRSRKHRGVAR